MKEFATDTFFFESIPVEVDNLAVRQKREVKQGMWLEAYAANGWRAACDAADVGDEQVMRWMRRDTKFKQAHADAAASVALRLETLVDAIATGETDATPAQVTLLQFRLKALRPDVYRERASVSVDQRTTLTAGIGEGGRARIMLAEWQGGEQSSSSQHVIDNSGG